MDPTAPTEAPAQVGRYVLIHPLGSGGTSTVHAAVREGDARLVVLKQLRVELAGQRQPRSRLRREAELASLLVHPGIAQLYDAGWADGVLYLVMEHIPGVTVAQLARTLLAQDRLVPYAVSLSFARQVLMALEHAHALSTPDGAPLGLVHRDLTPSNLMLDEHGRARIIDFGVARIGATEDLTVPGTVLGTPRYLSPEQARGEVIDARSDLYSFSVVLYELLTTQRLTPKGDRAAIFRSVLEDVPPPAHHYNPRLPPALSAVLQRALQKDAADRFESAAALRLAIEEACGAWAFVSLERMAGFFSRHFSSVSQSAEAMRAEAQRIGAGRQPANLSFEVFERAQAELHVPTKPDVVQPAPLTDPEAMLAKTRTEVPAEGVDETLVDPPHPDDALAGDPLTVVTAVGEAQAQTTPEATDPEPQSDPTPFHARPTKPMFADPASRPLAPPLPTRPPAAPSRGQLGRGLVVVGALSIVAGAYLLGRVQGKDVEPPEVPVELVAPEEAPVRAVARPAPPATLDGGMTRAEAPEPEAAPEPKPAPAPPAAAAEVSASSPSPTPERPEPAAATKAASPAEAPPRLKTAPAPPPAPSPAGGMQSELTRLGTRIDALTLDPLDTKGFFAIHAAIDRLAAKLPADARTRVSLQLAAAERTLDPASLKGALRTLRAAAP